MRQDHTIFVQVGHEVRGQGNEHTVREGERYVGGGGGGRGKGEGGRGRGGDGGWREGVWKYARHYLSNVTLLNFSYHAKIAQFRTYTEKRKLLPGVLCAFCTLNLQRAHSVSGALT